MVVMTSQRKTTRNPFWFQQKTVALVGTLIILGIIGVISFSVIQEIRSLSPSDQLVSGCWFGAVNGKIDSRSLQYNFWSSHDYSITGFLYSWKLYERGMYSTRMKNGGDDLKTVEMLLTPEKGQAYTLVFIVAENRYLQLGSDFLYKGDCPIPLS